MSPEECKQVAADWFAMVEHTNRAIVMMRAFLYGPRHRVLVEAFVDELRLAIERSDRAQKILAEK